MKGADHLVRGQKNARKPMCAEIEKIRRRINRIDHALLRLLNQRARLVLKLAVAKKTRGLPVRDRIREDHVLSRVRENNGGPLDEASALEIFQLIIRKSRSIQHQIVRPTPESPLRTTPKDISGERNR
jgi:chorismate mutase